MKINFRLGVASAAPQIEGGDVPHTWKEWYEKGHIKDGSNPARANDHFNRWKEDIDLMAKMGITIYRLSVEWARIEPEKGSYDEAAIQWYKELLGYMKSKGISALLTLHHFSNPLWFEKSGGFAKRANIPVFLSFVEYTVRRLGDFVNEYITINEPNVFAVMGYFNGVFPPGKKSKRIAMKVQSVMAACHILSYKLIHELRREMGHDNTRVGFAHHARVFAPKNKRNLYHRICTRIVSKLFQDALARACLSGKFISPVKNYGKVKKGKYADFIGLNYYTRSMVSSLGDGKQENVACNDLGWEIYPEGIAECAKELFNIIKLPIYITENGTCDNNDSFRSRYIYDHLSALASSGLPVKRYYHWCFTDNFEWCEGESARFGLVHIDYSTQKRTVKQSGLFYSQIIKNKGVTSEMYEEFVKPKEYHL